MASVPSPPPPPPPPTTFRETRTRARRTADLLSVAAVVLGGLHGFGLLIALVSTLSSGAGPWWITLPWLGTIGVSALVTVSALLAVRHLLLLLVDIHGMVTDVRD